MSDGCHHHHDHEALSASSASAPPADKLNETFQVTGMDCSEEIAAIERQVAPLPGVAGVRANIVGSTVTIYHDGSQDRATLARAIDSAGVKVVENQEPAKGGRMSSTAILVAVSGAATGVGILSSGPDSRTRGCRRSHSRWPSSRAAGSLCRRPCAPCAPSPST